MFAVFCLRVSNTDSRSSTGFDPTVVRYVYCFPRKPHKPWGPHGPGGLTSPFDLKEEEREREREGVVGLGFKVLCLMLRIAQTDTDSLADKVAFAFVVLLWSSCYC